MRAAVDAPLHSMADDAKRIAAGANDCAECTKTRSAMIAARDAPLGLEEREGRDATSGAEGPQKNEMAG